MGLLASILAGLIALALLWKVAYSFGYCKGVRDMHDKVANYMKGK